jgi:hypothetical protein
MAREVIALESLFRKHVHLITAIPVDAALSKERSSNSEEAFDESDGCWSRNGNRLAPVICRMCSTPA